MKRAVRGFLAVVLLLSQGSGRELTAAGRVRKKPATEAAAVANVPGPAPELRQITVEENRVRISLNQLTPYKTYLLPNPLKLIVELGGVVNKAPAVEEMKGDLFDRVRVNQYGTGASLISRVVFDLLQPVDYEAHPIGTDIFLTLKPNPVSGRGDGSKGKGTLDLLANLPTEKIDLDFEGEDVRNALKLLAELSKINIIYGPEVAGNITLHLKQVPFDQAFRTVLSMSSLVVRQLGDSILWIMTPASLTQSRTNAEVSTRTIILNYAKVDSVKSNLDQIRGAAGRKGISVTDPRTNSITIMDTPEGLDEAERLINLLDKKPKQILIEAKIIEVAYDNSIELGVRWEALYNNTVGGSSYGLGSTLPNLTPAAVPFTQNGSLIQATQNQGGVPNGVVPNPPGARGLGVSLPASNPTGEITFGFVNNTLALATSLSLLASKNKSRTLSEPRIITLNAESAHIDSSKQIPYNVQTIGQGGTITNSTTFQTAGVTLDVTPTVNSQDQLMLIVHATVSSPLQNTLGGSTQPIIQQRNAQTTMMVRDGQTIAVGGLISDTTSNSVAKIPILGDIPLLGIFFRHKIDSTQRNELIAFITPHIIKD